MPVLVFMARMISMIFRHIHPLHIQLQQKNIPHYDGWPTSSHNVWYCGSQR